MSARAPAGRARWIGRALLVLAAFVLVALALPRAATAQAGSSPSAAVDAAAREVAAGLRCPVCQGVSIHDSPTELAGEMRAVIRRQLHEGRTPDEVRAYFVERYGEWVLLRPEPRGFNLLVYLLPLAGMAAGGALVVLLVGRWTRPDPAPVRLTTAGLEAEAR